LYFLQSKPEITTISISIAFTDKCNNESVAASYTLIWNGHKGTIGGDAC